MAVTVAEIQELAGYLTKTYHAKRLSEQTIDQSYINDTFAISFLQNKDGTYKIPVVKTGKAYRMVSAPAEHIITAIPQIYRVSRKKKDTEADKRIAVEANRWVNIMSHQNPNPFKEHPKENLGYGEAWLYVIHNNNFDREDPNDMPFQIIVVNPMIAFSNGDERNGVPSRLVISYERVASNIKQNYPDWKWTKRESGKKDSDKVPFLIYIDKDIRYFEAAKDPLLTDGEGNIANGDGIQENIYGFVNFVHSYSGFGVSSADGDPASLAVSRIRYCRDLIAEYAAIRSVVDHLVFSYAYPSLDWLYNPEIITNPDGQLKGYSREPGAINKVAITPGGGLKKGVDMLPDQSLYQHLYNIEKQISEEDPLSQIGQAMGTSGRQQLDAEATGLRRYDTIVENTQHSFETAMGMGLRIIETLKVNDKGDSLYPEGIKEGDIGGNYELKLELKAEDPIANQIRSADGDRKWQARIISAEENLTKYQGYTQEEAEKINDDVIVEDVILHDPIIRRLIAVQIAKEMGMEEQYTALEQQLGQMEKGISTTPQIGSEGGEPRVGNVKTQLGREMPDMSLSQRPMRQSPMEAPLV